ncbi:MAG: BfmA/BtgA family mobilization protein [Leeuwenhoekiella sp.]
MEPFYNIRFKIKTARRFQKFSKNHFKTHTDTLAAMLDFFDRNEVSPKEDLGPTARRLEQSLLKRMNAIIAIIRDIEKSKTTPTLALLQALFEEADQPRKKPLILEKRLLDETEPLNKKRLILEKKLFEEKKFK